MRSMTGFGRHSETLTDKEGQVTIEVIVRTVNGRFLETRAHLPREYLPQESELKKKMQGHIHRGTVDVFVTRRVSLTRAHQVQLHEGLALEYQKELIKLSRKLNIKEAPTLNMIINLPEIVKVESRSLVSKKEEKSLASIFEKAIQNCLKERRREGEALRKELLVHLKKLNHEMAIIRRLRSEVNESLQERYLAKIRQRLSALNEAYDPQRLLQEVVIQIDKADISEELGRLDEHLKNYQNLLVSDESEGKKLDFYTQELLREINTIGSKSQVAEVTQSVIQCKTLIEKLREQIQNVE